MAIVDQGSGTPRTTKQAQYSYRLDFHLEVGSRDAILTYYW